MGMYVMDAGMPGCRLVARSKVSSASSMPLVAGYSRVLSTQLQQVLVVWQANVPSRPSLG